MTSHDEERDTPMTGIYLGVLAVEALIISALYALGRMFA